MVKEIGIPVIILCVIAATTTYVIHYLKNRSTPAGTVFVSGNIEATEVDLSFRLAGQIKTLPIEEGDRIAKNQVISTLDTDSLEAAHGSVKGDIAALTATLDELEEGTRKEVIESARAQAKAAESRLKNSRDEYERYYPLFNQGAISASLFDTKQTAFKVAQEEFNNLSERLAELEKGPREQEITAARGRLEKAKWDLKKIELDIEHSTLRSPTTGAILVKANELGEVVLPGATVATVAEIDKVWLKGYIGEKDLGLVKLGQKAHINTDSFPGKIYEGVVTFISSRAEFTPKNVQTREERVKQVYRVKVTIPNPEQELKIGMPGEGYILVSDNNRNESNELALSRPEKKETPTSLILTEELCKDFGPLRAVNNLNLKVEKGELFGLIGPDGAGKTTTMRMLAGILRPSSGNAYIDGISVRENPDKVKEHLAYMPQRFGLYQDLTVLENLMFYADLFGVLKKARSQRIEQLFEFSRLGPFADRPAGALSGGMKQKLGLACALIHSPQVLLLDEPTNGVDPVSRRDFWKILYDLLMEGITILVSTAYLDEAERTTRTAFMRDGSIIELGTPKDLKAKVRGVLLEIIPSNVRIAKAALRIDDRVLDVNVFGDSLHVRLNSESDESYIKEIMDSSGIEIKSFRRIAPAMEDVFLSVLSKRENPS